MTVGDAGTAARTSSGLDARLPLVIAVTGHRDPVPDQRDELRRAVESILADLDRRAPRTPFLVLSPLAKGCDRIFAEACLDFRGRRPEWRDLRDDPRGGIELIVPLPMPLAEYEEDFAHPDDLAEFRGLLRHAARSVAVTMPRGITIDHLRHERTMSAGRGGGPLRDEQYARLGSFIAMQSNLVVAMWDGRLIDKPGGTSAVLRLCDEGRLHSGAIPFRPRTKELEPRDRVPVAWIATRRASSAELIVGPPTTAGLDERITACRARLATSTGAASRAAPASRDAWDRLGEHLRWIDDANARLARARPAYPPTGPPTPLDSCFVAVDAAASAAKRTLLGWMKGFIALVAAAILALQATTAWSVWVLPLLYLLGLISAWVAFRLLRRARLEERAADLRLLAEALRIQRHWLQAAIPEQVADHYLAHRAAEIPRLRGAMRGATLVALLEAAGEAGSRSTPASVGEVRKHWLEDQRDYLRRTLQRIRRRERRWWWIVRTSGTLVVALALVSLWLSLGGRSDRSPGVTAWTDFACGAALALSLAFGLWRQVQGDKEDGRRYRVLGDLYDAAIERCTPLLAQSAEGASGDASPRAGQTASSATDAGIPLDAPTQVAPPGDLEVRPRSTGVKVPGGRPPLDDQPGVDDGVDDGVAREIGDEARRAADSLAMTRLREIYRAMGKEALDETAAWHSLHRETLDELPVG